MIKLEVKKEELIWFNSKKKVIKAKLEKIHLLILEIVQFKNKSKFKKLTQAAII